MADPSIASSEFYVGYLPVPPSQRRFLRRTVPAALWLLCAMTFMWARSQHSPGAGDWENGRSRTFRGMLAASPYPVLFADDAGAGAPGPLLLVEVGKHGGGQRAAPFDGRHVAITGWLLRREGRQMLEMDPAQDAIQIDSALATPLPSKIDRGPVTLSGEIVDSKCYLGAMKPGEGKTHKSCATLCIKGGIPPMFVSVSPSGRRSFHLLTSADGEPVDSSILPLVADPVDLRGSLADWGGLSVLRVRRGDVSRR